MVEVFAAARRNGAFWSITVALVSAALFFHRELGFSTATYWMRMLTWKEEQGISDRVFFLMLHMIVHEVTFVVSNALLYVLYYAEIPYFEQYRVQKGKYPDHALVMKCVRMLLLNHIIVAPVTILLNYDSHIYFGMKWDAASLPSGTQLVSSILLFMLIEDAVFYCGHRTLHHPRIYKHVHKRHHEFKATIGLASEYAEPIEFIIANGLPVVIGPILTGAHVFTYLVWMFIRVAETVDGHSGYAFPWAPWRYLPFAAGADVHDFHHSHNVGNFASFFTHMDQLFGTDAAWKRHLEKAEAKKSS